MKNSTLSEHGGDGERWREWKQEEGREWDLGLVCKMRKDKFFLFFFFKDSSLKSEML